MKTRKPNKSMVSLDIDVFIIRWEPAENFNDDLVEHFWECAGTSGRDHKDPGLFTEGEEIYRIGPPRVYLKTCQTCTLSNLANVFQVVNESARNTS
jgi:hypothetical protein